MDIFEPLVMQWHRQYCFVTLQPTYQSDDDSNLIYSIKDKLIYMYFNENGPRYCCTNHAIGNIYCCRHL